MAHGESKDLTSGTLVIGLGRFGSTVTVILDKFGYEILIVEGGPARVRVFAGCFPLAEADTTSMDALEQPDVQEFRVAVVGADSSLKSSVLITANLVDLGIPSTRMKAISCEYGWILYRIGAHHVIYPESDAGQCITRLMGERVIDHIEMEKGDSAIVKLCPPREIHGFTLEDLDLRGRYGVNMFGILRPDQPFEYAKAQTRINPEDIIIVSGDVHLLEYFTNRPRAEGAQHGSTPERK